MLMKPIFYTTLLSLLFTISLMAQSAFITKWKTTADGETITIPTALGEIYNYTVDWGDGRSSTGHTGNATHTYAAPGTHIVKITGNFPRIYFDNSDDNKDKIIEVTQWGTQVWKSMERAFYGCSKLNVTAADAPNLSQVRSMFAMFSSATAFNGDLSSWDLSNVTNMSFMFNYATAFNRDLSNWKVGSVTNMSYMFRGARAFDKNLSSWDVSSVTNMESMFQDATAFSADINNWDVSSVTTMAGMFRDATTFNRDLSNWDVSKVVKMENMFANVTLSTAHYDAMLDAWSKQAVQPNVTLDAGGSKYCGNGEAGRTKLTSAPNNWSITDSGKDSTTNCGTLSVVAHDAAPWQLSPNPTSGVLHISGTMPVEKATVHTLTGQQPLRVSGNNVLSLESMRPGLYLVKLINQDKTQVFKIIKE